MKVIVVLNQKGGAGKTTISVNMSARLTLMDSKVQLIDADYHQESATTWAALNEGRYFDVVKMEAAQIKNHVRRNADVVDYFVVDCPPRANEDAGKFIEVADIILIPVQPSPYDVWACNDLIELIQRSKELTRSLPGMPKEGKPHAAFVLSRATKGTRLIGETADALMDTGFHVLKAMTTQYNVYKRSPMTGNSIYDVDAKEKEPRAEEQINKITDEVLEILHNDENQPYPEEA